MRIYIAAICLIGSQVVCCQINNFSFESWNIAPDSLEYPIGWTANTDSWSGGTYKRFERDTIGTHGEFSVKTFHHTGVSSWQGCSSMMSSFVEIDELLGEDRKLSAFVKSESQNNQGVAYSEIRVLAFKNNEYIDKVTWSSFDEINEFTKVDIELPFPEADRLVFELYGSALDRPADGCYLFSTTWFDELRLNSVTSTVETDKHSELTMYPNPDNGNVKILEGNDKIKNYKVLDKSGRLIQHGSYNPNGIDIDESGIYILIVEFYSGKSDSKRVFNKLN